MTAIKSEFIAKYEECKIETPSEYKMKNVTSPVVFCVDCVYRKKRNANGRRCDEFIFFDISRDVDGIYLVERKTNSTNVSKVKDQLQGGANFVAGFLHDDAALDESGFNFSPVFVSRGIGPSQRAKLTTIKVKLRQQSKRIRYSQYKAALPKI